MDFIAKYLQREKRFLKNINRALVFLPLILLPLLIEWWFHAQELTIFVEYKHQILLVNIIYILLGGCFLYF